MIFDVDGALLDTNYLHVTAWREAFRERAAPWRAPTSTRPSGTGPARAVMVGDTVWDVLAARGAGLPCVGLLSGGISEEELHSAGAAETYPGPAALLESSRAARSAVSAPAELRASGIQRQSPCTQS